MRTLGLLPGSARAFGGFGRGGGGLFAKKAGNSATSGAAPFAPTDIAGLTVWFKAGAITGKVDGDALTTWADSSGNSRTATAGVDPMTYKTDQQNGKPGVRMIDPANVNAAYAVTPSIPAITAWTLFLVFKGFTAAARYILDAADGSHSIIQGYVGGKIEYFSSPRTVLGDMSTSAFQIITCTVGGTSTGVWTLGGALAHSAGDLSGVTFLEIIAYNSAISGGDVTDVQTYLQAEYAL